MCFKKLHFPFLIDKIINLLPYIIKQHKYPNYMSIQRTQIWILPLYDFFSPSPQTQNWIFLAPRHLVALYLIFFVLILIPDTSRCSLISLSQSLCNSSRTLKFSIGTWFFKEGWSWNLDWNFEIFKLFIIIINYARWILEGIDSIADFAYFDRASLVLDFQGMARRWELS